MHLDRTYRRWQNPRPHALNVGSVARALSRTSALWVEVDDGLSRQRMRPVRRGEPSFFKIITQAQSPWQRLTGLDGDFSACNGPVYAGARQRRRQRSPHPDTAGLAGLSAKQSCILTALLMDKSTPSKPLSSQQIGFSFISNESGATLIALNGGITDSTGKAYAVYTAGTLQPGLHIQDTVQANIKDFSGVVTITRKGGGGSTAGFQISVTAAPTSVAAGGASVITATVTNADSEAVSGQTVSFDFLTNNSGAALSASSAVTDGGGKAVVGYQAGSPTVDVQDIVQASINGPQEPSRSQLWRGPGQRRRRSFHFRLRSRLRPPP